MSAKWVKFECSKVWSNTRNLTKDGMGMSRLLYFDMWLQEYSRDERWKIPLSFLRRRFIH